MRDSAILCMYNKTGFLFFTTFSHFKNVIYIKINKSKFNTNKCILLLIFVLLKTTTTLRSTRSTINNKRLYVTQPLPTRQVFTWKSTALLGITAVGLAFYFKQEKERLRLLRKLIYYKATRELTL